MIYPAWTTAPSVYPDWIGIIRRLINGDVIVLRQELRMAALGIEDLLTALPPEIRAMLLRPECKMDRLPPEIRMVLLPQEQRLDLRPEGII